MKGNKVVLSLLLLQGCAPMPQKPVAYATVPSQQQEHEARLAEQAKRQEDQRRKEKEKIDQKERGIWVISQKEKGNLDQRGHWKKKKEIFGQEGGGFFEDQDHQGFLDSCSV